MNHAIKVGQSQRHEAELATIVFAKQLAQACRGLPGHEAEMIAKPALQIAVLAKTEATHDGEGAESIDAGTEGGIELARLSAAAGENNGGAVGNSRHGRAGSNGFHGAIPTDRVRNKQTANMALNPGDRS